MFTGIVAVLHLQTPKGMGAYTRSVRIPPESSQIVLNRAIEICSNFGSIPARHDWDLEIGISVVLEWDTGWLVAGSLLSQ